MAANTDISVASGYEQYEIRAYANPSLNRILPPIILKPGERGLVFMTWGDTGQVGHRAIGVENSAGVTKVTAYQAYFNKAETNEHCIPYEIYGYKGVTL